MPITIKYLRNLGTPVARIDTTYNFPRGKQNHCRQDGCLPERNALAENAIVMLLSNFLVKLNLKNGAIGKLIKFVYKDVRGPMQDPRNLPAYAIVDFPDCKIPPEDALVDSAHPTWVPIPVVELRCEKNCCSERGIPLRVDKAVSTYKCQGVTIGKGHPFQRIVLGLPRANARHKTPGLETTAFSRAETYTDFAIADDEPLAIEQLLTIGQGQGMEM